MSSEYFPAGAVHGTQIAPGAMQDSLAASHRHPIAMGKRGMGARVMASGQAAYYPAGQARYFPAGALPPMNPTFRSGTPRSAWWLSGLGADAMVNATTGYEFIKAFQTRLGVGSDGNWGNGTSTAFKNWLAGNMPNTGRVTEVVANLTALIGGTTTAISQTTLLFALWFTYHRDTADKQGMISGGTIPVRFGTTSVTTPPYRTAPPRPTRLEGLVSYPASGTAPALGGTSAPPPPAPRPPTPTPGTTGQGTPGTGTGTGGGSNIPNIAGSAANAGPVAWFNKQSTVTKVSIGLGAATLVGLGIWAVMDDGEPAKPAKPGLPPPPPPRPQYLPMPTQRSAPRPIVKVNFNTNDLQGARRR